MILYLLTGNGVPEKVVESMTRIADTGGPPPVGNDEGGDSGEGRPRRPSFVGLIALTLALLVLLLILWFRFV